MYNNHYELLLPNNIPTKELAIDSINKKPNIEISISNDIKENKTKNKILIDVNKKKIKKKLKNKKEEKTITYKEKEKEIEYK